MKIRNAILSILIIVLAASCGRANKTMAEALNMVIPAENETSSEEIKVPDDRKIIKEGEMTFESSDPVITRGSVLKTTTELGGYITKESSYEYNDRKEQRMVIRVPADKFDRLLSGVTETAVKIDSKSISVQDITEDYIDIEARLKTRKELEERYKQLLSKASKVDEIMSIEREIGKLREEIESAEGRFRYLKDRVAFSTLTIIFYEKISRPLGFSTKFGHAVKSGWRNFLMFISGFVSLWPFLILIGGGLYAGFRIRKKRIKTEKVQQ